VRLLSATTPCGPLSDQLLGEPLRLGQWIGGFPGYKNMKFISRLTVTDSLRRYAAI